MLLNQKRLKYLCLASFSFMLGCTLTLLFLHGTALKLGTSEKSSKLKLLVLVISAAKNQDRRDAIRETWAQASSNDVKILFVLSRDTFSNAEKLVHNDILEVNVPDNYRLLSRKLIESFNSVHSLNFEYLLKCDDDSFVDVPGVVGELIRAPDRKYYWGYFDGNAHIKRAGKWKETGWMLCDKYLPYALGGGYVISKDLVVYIVNNRDYLRYVLLGIISYCSISKFSRGILQIFLLLCSLFISEDVSVGAWLAPLNITRKHDRRFDTEFRSRGCDNNHLVTHKRSPQVMRLYWSRIVQTGHMCDKEYKDTSSYEYNWLAMPSKCCIKNSSLHP